MAFKKKEKLSEAEIARKKYMRKKFVSDRVWPVARFIILFCLCFVILYPILYMLSTSFSPQAEMDDPTRIWIPKDFTFSNIVDAWNAMKYPQTFAFTVLVNIVSAFLSVISCAITGYGFARFNFKGKGLCFGIVVLMVLVPPQILFLQQSTQFRNFPLGAIIFSIIMFIVLVATFMIVGQTKISNLGLFIICALEVVLTIVVDIILVKGEIGEIVLTNTPFVMYLPAITASGLRAGLFIFIFRQFFKGLPKELEDAAYLDGCSPLKTFVVVMVPNAISSFITVFLFSIVWYWNDTYTLPMFYSGSESTKTISMKISDVGTTMITYLYGKSDSALLGDVFVWLQAASLLAMLPIIILYVCLQKYFTEGIERSGLVG